MIGGKKMLVQYLIGGAMIALAVVLIAMILKQTGKEQGLSGAISGGSTETYFGKSGGSTKEKRLFRWTVVGSVAFVVLSFALTILVYVANAK